MDLLSDFGWEWQRMLCNQLRSGLHIDKCSVYGISAGARHQTYVELAMGHEMFDLVVVATIFGNCQTAGGFVLIQFGN